MRLLRCQCHARTGNINAVSVAHVNRYNSNILGTLTHRSIVESKMNSMFELSAYECAISYPSCVKVILGHPLLYATGLG